MTNPTSNFGWQMPTSTDLVTDLPADFEVFGQAVDTSLADLKGGTTGQVLAKASNTDMDFVWSADAAGMTNPMTTTGDTIYSSSGSTPARLGIGTTGQVLTVAGGVPSWATAAAGGKILQVVQATTTTSVATSTSGVVATGLEATITPSSATSQVLILVTQPFQVNRSSGTTDMGGGAYLHRATTAIFGGSDTTGIGYLYLQNHSGQAFLVNRSSWNYLDSPATTSATTYSTRMVRYNADSVVTAQPNSLGASIILMEVGA